jgi:hypothetical protein
MLQRLSPAHLLIGRAKASDCFRFFRDHLGHRAVIAKCPALGNRHVASRSGCLDLSQRAIADGLPDTDPARKLVFQLQRGLAPPVMPPSITSSAPVT